MKESAMFDWDVIGRFWRNVALIGAWLLCAVSLFTGENYDRATVFVLWILVVDAAMRPVR